jgi:hypothetical protein
MKQVEMGMLMKFVFTLEINFTISQELSNLPHNVCNITYYFCYIL